MSAQPKTDVLSASSSAHEKALFKCRTAENAERFDDMAVCIKELCSVTDHPLGASERNYLSVAYKNAVGPRRSSLRCLAGMKAKYEAKEGAGTNVDIITELYDKVLAELEEKCKDVIDLIKNKIMTDAILAKLPGGTADAEFKVFFWKMMADYYRYISEFSAGEKKTKAVADANEYYQKAADLAKEHLEAMHPIRLGLFLNFSVFLYEIQEEPEKAQDVARKAFDEAVAQLDKASQDTEHKDSTLIMQLLRDNLTLWSSVEESSAAAAQEQAAAAAQEQAAAAAQPGTAAAEEKH